jgi:2-(1,2-epoxy-1,2-dihydrophenyl)acetyl-CoA isomerase
MSYETIRFTVEDGVAHIVLVRPKQANTVTIAFSNEFSEVAEKCKTEKNIRAVLISSEGPIFSAGGDLAVFAGYGEELPSKMQEMLDTFHGALKTLSEMDAPVIVAVNGVAAGAGFSMVLNASMVLASPKARFTMAYTGAGLTPDGSSTFFLPKIVGLRRAEEMMLTNRQLSAEEATDWGIVNQLTDETELLEKALKTAKRIAKGPTKAFGNVRRLLVSSFDADLAQHLDREGESIVDMTKTVDGKEGIAAFLEKRAPEFQGK